MEHNVHVLGPEVPKGRGVARNAFANAIIANTGGAISAQPIAAFADPKRQSVGGAKAWMMTGGTGDISVARQNSIVE